MKIPENNSTTKLEEVEPIFLIEGVHLYASVCFVVFGMFYWFLLHSLYMLLSNCAFGFLCAINYLVYSRYRKGGQRDTLIAAIFLSVVYLGLINVVVHVGETDSPLIFWGISIVMAAAFVFSIQGILIWVALGLVFYPITLFLKRSGFTFGIISLDLYQTRFLNEASYYGLLLFVGYLFYLFQQKLAAVLGRLKQSEEKHRGVFDSALDAMVFFDKDSMIIKDVNPAFCSLYGYSRDEAIGMRVTDISAEPQQTESTIRGQAIRVVNRFHRRKDGSVFPVEISSSYFSKNDQRHSIATIRDVSERNRIEEEREILYQAERHARAEAHRSNQAKDVFLATLSHELRTPLTAIHTWAQLLRMGNLDSAKTRHGIEAIEKSAQAQGRIINDLLDVSRIISGKLQLDIKEVNPVTLVNDSIDTIRAAAELKSLVIRTVLDPEFGLIQADPVRLKQILWNLLTNAIKFSSPKGEITVQMERGPEGCLQITVSDLGKGIPESHLTKIFEPFTQVDGSSIRAHGGLGLGLTIVRTLVDLHGGKVKAESPGDGLGAKFTVSLPTRKLEKRGDFQKVAELPKPGEVDLTGIRVLVVDDDQDICEAIRLLLKSFGANSVCSGSAVDALKLIPEFNPHLIISDIAMPGGDGYSFMKSVRAELDESLRQIPAIALTAYVGPEENRRAIESGFQVQIEKPVDSGVLLATIAKLLSISKETLTKLQTL